MAAQSVILLPGFGCDGDSMLELHEALANEGEARRLQVAEFSGCTSLAEMVLRVQGMIEAPSCTLIGFSMGGWLAQAVAARTPGRVARLVLLASWTRAPASYLESVRALHDAIHGGAPLSDLRSAVVSGIANSANAPALADRWLAMVERVGAATFVAETSAILADPHVESDARSLRIPVLVLAGAEDTFLPAESQEADAGRIGGATFHRIEASGHNLVWEQPAAVNRRVLHWLDEQLI